MLFRAPPDAYYLTASVLDSSFAGSGLLIAGAKLKLGFMTSSTALSSSCIKLKRAVSAFMPEPQSGEVAEEPFVDLSNEKLLLLSSSSN